MSTRKSSLKKVTLAIGTLALAAAPYAAAQDTAPQEPRKPWTRGTTQAANEVVGARSGLGFRYQPPPVNDTPPPIPDMPELTVSAVSVSGLVQTLDLSANPPPQPELPPSPIAVRVRLYPPGPTTPARLELHILDATAIEIFGPNGESAYLCGGGTAGQ